MQGGRNTALAEPPNAEHDLKFSQARSNLQTFSTSAEEIWSTAGVSPNSSTSANGVERIIAGNHHGFFFASLACALCEQLCAQLWLSSLRFTVLPSWPGHYENPLGAIHGDKEYDKNWVDEETSGEEEDHSASKGAGVESEGGWQHVVGTSEVGVVYLPFLDAEEPGAGDTLSTPEDAPSFVISMAEDPLLFRTHTMVMFCVNLLNKSVSIYLLP